MPGTKSCFSGYFYLASHLHPLNYNGAPHNSPILVKCRALKNTVCSVTEGEYSGLFHNAQNAVMIQIILEALGHLQKATKIKTDNSTANVFVHASMQIKERLHSEKPWKSIGKKGEIMIWITIPNIIPQCTIN
eukprot:15241237-Ditylum_brightwellii.AAC.1